jgi:hypothetical protein
VVAEDVLMSSEANFKSALIAGRAALVSTETLPVAEVSPSVRLALASLKELALVLMSPLNANCPVALDGGALAPSHAARFLIDGADTASLPLI